MRNGLQKLIRNFFLCGCLGWCWEILVTSLAEFRKKDFNQKLIGKTSLWMFPIYGMGALLPPVFHLLKRQKLWLRGFVYMALIFLMEYASGSWLSKRRLCPWNYSHARWNIGGLIRLDYAPGWFLLGLLYEKILKPKEKKSPLDFS